MKRLLILLASLYGLFIHLGCSKESFTEDPAALLSLSVDTLRFDTVFTTTGSVTQGLKIFNRNNRGIRISQLELAGANASFFALNADGISARQITGLEIAAGDSLYLFATVTIQPNAQQLPFLVRDSIRIRYNENQLWVQLEAFGQNARFIRNGVLKQNTRFTADLPYVILGGLRVDTTVTLTIDPGTRIYLHADAPLIVDGSLQVNGTRTDSVVFRGDRLDNDYRDLPASWPGIYFRKTSVNNKLKYARVLNAYQAIVVDQPASNGNPKLTLDECIIDNIYDNGITAINSSIQASNCLISNCGLNILLASGGNYAFTHCTVASYSSLFLVHKKPVLLASNWDSTQQGILSYPLQAVFTNNIFWGDNGTVEDEVVVSQRGNAPFQAIFRNNLYKALRDPISTVFTNNIKNQDPLFDSIQVSARYYNFRLDKNPSPAINKGLSTGLTTDLDGKPRDAQPDLGCYEKN